jgi:hypothetical protein
MELNLNEDPGSTATITVLNAMGSVVSRQILPVSNSVLEQQIQLDKTLPGGIYFVNVSTGDAMYSARLFLQK